MSKPFLVIEDSDEIVVILQSVISELGYEIDRAANGPDGVRMASENEYTCILLDVMLPGLEGTEVCKRIRQQRESVPIIMLTSKSDELHKVLALELGADDYVTKPFSQNELKARIKAVLRRSERVADNQEIEELTFGPIVIDTARRLVTKHGAPVEFTALQFDLLALLARRAGRPVTREQLSAELFGYNVSGFEDSLTVHISRIRAKLEENPADPKLILTVRGIGYSFADTGSTGGSIGAKKETKE